mgnify:CR=1 FL=1
MRRQERREERRKAAKERREKRGISGREREQSIGRTKRDGGREVEERVEFTTKSAVGGASGQGEVAVRTALLSLLVSMGPRKDWIIIRVVDPVGCVGTFWFWWFVQDVQDPATNGKGRRATARSRFGRSWEQKGIVDRRDFRRK